MGSAASAIGMPSRRTSTWVPLVSNTMKPKQTYRGRARMSRLPRPRLRPRPSRPARADEVAQLRKQLSALTLEKAELLDELQEAGGGGGAASAAALSKLEKEVSRLRAENYSQRSATQTQSAHAAALAASAEQVHELQTALHSLDSHHRGPGQADRLLAGRPCQSRPVRVARALRPSGRRALGAEDQGPVGRAWPHMSAALSDARKKLASAAALDATHADRDEARRTSRPHTNRRSRSSRAWCLRPTCPRGERPRRPRPRPRPRRPLRERSKRACTSWEEPSRERPATTSTIALGTPRPVRSLRPDRQFRRIQERGFVHGAR